jgi:hypothetical protein
VSETVQIALLSAVINGAVTWGIISTKLAWLRRDVDSHQERLDQLDRRAPHIHKATT